MSDYFAAMLRATGLAGGVPLAAAAGDELDVIDQQVTVAAPTGQPAVSTPAQARALSAEPTPLSVQTVAGKTLPVAEPASASTTLAQPQAVDSPIPPVPQPAAVEPALAPQALMQSVMRWVAADDPQPAPEVIEQSVAQPVITERSLSPAQPAVANPPVQPASSPAAMATTQQSIATPVSVTVSATEGPIEPLAQPSPVIQQPASVRETAEQQAAYHPQPQAHHQPADPLSISIGSIHLRVEAPAAPAPQPIPRAKPSVAQAAAVRAAAPARSSLSRRALRPL